MIKIIFNIYIMDTNIYHDDELKKCCKNILDMNNEIKSLREQIKLLSNNKSLLENKVIEKLNNYNEKYYNFSNYNFKKNISTTEGSIKPEYISEILLTYVTDDTMRIKELIKNILDKRIKNEKTSLKIKQF